MIPNAISRIAAVSSLAIAFVVSPAGAVPRYTAVQLDAVLPSSSYAWAINASGDVAGEFYDWDAGGVAFRYIGGVMQVLGTMGAGSTGTGISDDGQVAIDSWGTGRALLYTGKSMQDLGTLGGRLSGASGISTDGHVTGWSTISGTATHAFRYASGAMQDLGTLGGVDSWGVGINQAGDVTGSSTLPDSSTRAFIYSGGVMRTLGTFSGGGDSYAYAINALGQVTGSASADRVFQHAFLYTNGTMLDLGTVRDDHSIGDSFGYAINSRGDVTGYYDVALGCLCKAWNSFRAFLYTDGAMYDLNSLVVSGLDGFTLTQAAGINDHGQIAATGGNGHEMRAFRLDPLGPPDPTPDLNQHGLTGSWYRASTSGQGVEVEVFPDAASGTGSTLVSWFTYDTTPGGADHQRWYTAQGPVVTGQPNASLTIYQNTGGNFDAPPATTAQPVGTATLSFDTCSSGQLAYNFTDGRTATIALTRLTQNVTCSTTTPYPTNADFALSGNWFGGLATSGQGLMAEVNPISGAFFAAWYTYMPSGTTAGAAGQRWYTAQGAFTPGQRSIPVTIYETTGGMFDTPTTPVPQTVAVGTGTMAFQNCTAATFSYNFTGGSSSGLSGAIVLSRAGPVPPGCT
jgi:probable HAF family extracellular repeat protein